MSAPSDRQLAPLTTGDARGAAIEVRELSKRYDGPLVVDHVSFDVAQGEFVTLLGPSGSGKTSTLMIVAGFEQPTGGDVRLRGRSIVDVPPRRRDLGIVFQSYALFPHMTALDNVAFPLRMRGVERAERLRRAGDMLERVHLGELAGRKPRQLSGGQQQRVALARALVFDPAALLLDEPLGALDKRLRDQLQIEIKSIQQRMDISVIFVTHDQSEAMMLSDRIAVMNRGRIEQIGPPEELYSHPTTSFVATFLGETNLLPCEVGPGADGEATVVLADGSRGPAHLGATARREGEDCAISVRPERVRLLAAGETAQCSVGGVLRGRTFLGSSHRFVVEALGGEIVVSAPDGVDVPSVQPGDPVTCGWDAHDAQVLVVGER